MDLDLLQDRLGHRFARPGLLGQALTHRSYGQPNNERLEFLGDSVLNCAMATLLFERFPDDAEGDLSRLRAHLVKQQGLHRVAQRLELGKAIRMGEGESRSGGARRPSILADALEAVFGALYLDGGFELARSVIGRLYGPELSAADPRTMGKDPKTRLQEELQRMRIPLPVYEVVATHGAAHDQVFDVSCEIGRLEIRATGSGGSRRAAEQAAAEAALACLAGATQARAKAQPKVRSRRGSAGTARMAAKADKPAVPEDDD
ncbi:MAG: ribonuclease III [Burkholderiaceae bacterium]